MDAVTCAPKLAALIPLPRLEESVWRVSAESAARGETWAVGFSGGSDSLAVLLLLWAHWPEQRGRLLALHFNHRLRGEESDEDERFCASVAQALYVKFIAGSWDVRPAIPSEDDARVARFRFFEATLADMGKALLFTGHHLDDVLETFFMRLARGASAGGLAAPRPIRRWTDTLTIVRPLLALRKAEVCAALTSAGATWRVDSSNLGDQFLRNRIRGTVVPAWLQAAGESAGQGAALTRKWLEEDDVALEQWLDELGVPRHSEALDLRCLSGKPKALWRRALHRWSPAAQLSRTAFEALMALAQSGGGRMSVGNGFALIAEGILSFQADDGPEPDWPEHRLPVGAELQLPTGASVVATSTVVDQNVQDRLRCRQFDPNREAIVECSDAILTVRQWRAGDRFKPLGAPGSAKVQDLFTNRKVPSTERAKLPVICSADGRILWIPGFPPAADSKITEHSVTAVQLTYRPGTITVRKQS
jgi:tRNA(Ile)-lysidine synthase